MYKFFVDKIDGDKAYIIGDDVNHIKNVLRLNILDEIEICNNEKSFKCEILNMQNEVIECEIIEQISQITEPTVHLHILQGLPKADKMESIIQKCTELGVKEITPIAMERSIVKLNEKDGMKKVERWQKIAEVAAKQSKRDMIPKINNIIKLDKIMEIINKYDILIVAYEEEKEAQVKEILSEIKNKEDLKIAVLVGPEGGIDKKEIEILKQGKAKIVTLGKRILRTETAPIVLATIIMYELNQM